MAAVLAYLDQAGATIATQQGHVVLQQEEQGEFSEFTRQVMDVMYNITIVLYSITVQYSNVL